MPFVLIALGIALTVVGVRNNQDDFYAQLQKDFTGPQSFTNWAVPVMVLGSIGYFKPAKGIVDLFLALMVLTFVVANSGGFEQLLPSLQKAFNDVVPSTTAGPPAVGSSSGGTATPAIPSLPVLPTIPTILSAEND